MDTRETDQQRSQRSEAVPHEGGRLGRMVDEQASRIPSQSFIGLAVGSMVLSAVTAIVFQKRPLGNFFGLWVPSLLSIGVYNKLQKIESQLDRQMLH